MLSVHSVHTIEYDAENQGGSPAFPALLTMVLVEREKRREKDRELFTPGRGWQYEDALSPHYSLSYSVKHPCCQSMMR